MPFNKKIFCTTFQNYLANRFYYYKFFMLFLNKEKKNTMKKKKRNINKSFE